MTNVLSCGAAADALRSTAHAQCLADRLEQGAQALAELARTLTEAQWSTRISGDGRTVGVVIHHVASVYPLEIQLAQQVANGQAITGVTMAEVHAMNAAHAVEFGAVTKEAAVDLLERNSASAARAIRKLTDAELTQSASVSLYADAPLTCQFLLEDHAVRHSYHHLQAIHRALRAQEVPEGSLRS